MDSKFGVPLIVAAVIIGFSVLGSAVMLKGSLDAGTAELSGVKSALGEFKTTLAAAAQPQRPQPAARRGPDPNKRHTINIAGSPAKGPVTAKVKIVEFSDFQ